MYSGGLSPEFMAYSKLSVAFMFLGIVLSLGTPKNVAV
jgi:hypothetical protein